MAIVKKTFIDGTTVINAQELNDWQDELIRLDEEKMDNEEGKGPSTNDFTDAYKTKLNGIQAGAQVNPGNATPSAAGLMSADDKTKLNGIQAGAQVNPDNATPSAAGLMSADDKTKLNGIESGAQVNPDAATTDSAGLMSAADKTKLNGIESGAQVNPGNATQTAAGLMSATDKTKLDGLAADLGITGAAANDLVAVSSVSSGRPTAFKKLAGNTFEVLVVEIASFSSMPKTQSNSGIESDMVCLHAELGTPAAQLSDWTVTTAAGSVTISGTISGSTTLKLYLMKSR